MRQRALGSSRSDTLQSVIVTEDNAGAAKGTGMNFDGKFVKIRQRPRPIEVHGTVWIIKGVITVIFLDIVKDIWIINIQGL